MREYKGNYNPSFAKCRLKTTEYFIKKAKEKHGDYYDYSKVVYIGNKHKVIIICPKHGEFLQRPATHLFSNGCIKCKYENMYNPKKLNTETFIKLSKKEHGELYDYSLVEYKNCRTKVKIICKKHGVFNQRPTNHKNGDGCPKCRSSHGENKIRKLLSNKVHFIEQKLFPDCKIIRPLAFDFYIPHLNMCIEYDGIQHFKPVKHFGGLPALDKYKKTDEIKTNYCKNNNIKLLRISYKDNIEQIITENI